MAKTLKVKTPLRKKATKKVASPKKKLAKKRPMPLPESEINKLIALASAEYALEKKATNIKILDVRDITSFADYFVVASGSSNMQVKAIAENIIAKMRENGIKAWKTEGWDALQWVIIDFVDVVVHIFQEVAREFYHLERLWADAPMEVFEDKPLKRKKVA